MSKRKSYTSTSTPSVERQLEMLATSSTASEFDSTHKTRSHSPAKGSNQGYTRCYETHPALPLGDELVVYGGSCMHPIVEDADIYIGHDLSMAKSIKTFPWEQGESVLFHIPDMGVPADKMQYAKMLDWLVVQLTAQRKVHIGCIGGHGRTGMTLSSLVYLMLDRKDAIEYVRANYCTKVVESQAQVDFLHTLFGIDKVQPAKHYGGHADTATAHKAQTHNTTNGITHVPYSARATNVIALTQSGTIYPSESNHSVWGPNVSVVKAGKT